MPDMMDVTDRCCLMWKGEQTPPAPLQI